MKQKGWKNSAIDDSGGEGKGAAWEATDVPHEGYSDGKLARLAVDKLTSLQSAGKPFFLAVGFFKPHLPFNAPKRYWDLYEPASLELEDDGQRVKGISEHAHHSHRELGGYRDMPKDEHLDAATTRTLRHGYDLQKELAEEQSNVPEVQLRTIVAQRRMGQLMFALGDFDGARTTASTANSALLDLVDSIAPFEYWCELGHLSGLRCELERSSVDSKASLQYAITSVEAWQRAYELKSSTVLAGEYLTAQRRRGVVLETQRNYQEAKTAFDEALRLADEIPIAERSEKTEILRGQVSNSLGVLYSNMGDAETSEMYYLQAIEILVPVVEQRPERIDLGYNLAITSFNLGNRHARQRAHETDDRSGTAAEMLQAP